MASPRRHLSHDPKARSTSDRTARSSRAYPSGHVPLVSVHRAGGALDTSTERSQGVLVNSEPTGAGYVVHSTAGDVYSQQPHSTPQQYFYTSSGTTHDSQGTILEYQQIQLFHESANNYEQTKALNAEFATDGQLPLQRWLCDKDLITERIHFPSDHPSTYEYYCVNQPTNLQQSHHVPRSARAARNRRCDIDAAKSYRTTSF